MIPRVAQLTPAGLVEAAGALAQGTLPPHLAASLLANCGIGVMVLGLAWLAFRRQELTGATV